MTLIQNCDVVCSGFVWSHAFSYRNRSTLSERNPLGTTPCYLWKNREHGILEFSVGKVTVLWIGGGTS